MTGATAYFGLLDAGEAKEGETLFVSAAAGAVGSMVVQIARIKGMMVIGSAGGAQKCALVRALGADIAIDYKAPGSLVSKLKEAAPKGIDVYFDNVGGDHLDAALACARDGARFAECGMVAGYNVNDAHGPVPLHHLMQLIASRVRMRGFVVYEFIGRMKEFQKDMMAWVAEGRIKSAETVKDGLESTPEAFIGLFTGNNTGKMLVKL
jgi:NADPH-dependent curcumin reductase CurA